MWNLVLENVTCYDKMAIRALSEVSSRTVQRRRFLLRRAFLLVLGGLCLACGILLLLMFKGLDASDKAIGVGSFLMGALALAEGIFYRRFLAWNAQRSMLRGNGSPERYFLFTGDFIQVGQEGVESKYRYDVLLAAYETVGYFALFLDRRYGMVVDKNGFSSGTPEALRTLLEEKTGKPVEFVV